MSADQSMPVSESLTSAAVLSKETLLRRLKEDLIVSPILEPSQIGDGSVDISLGTRFIRSRRAKATEINFRELDKEKIRSFQESVVVPFGEHYILHSRSFVLGCTFEFIALPLDVCGFVLADRPMAEQGFLSQLRRLSTRVGGAA